MSFMEKLSVMTFARPMLLLLLVVPLSLAFWVWLHKGHPLVMPFDHGHQRRSRWLGRLVDTAGLIPSLLLALGIVLLAGPQQPAPPESLHCIARVDNLYR